MKELVANISKGSCSIKFWQENPRAEYARQSGSIVNWTGPMPRQPITIELTTAQGETDTYENVQHLGALEGLSPDRRRILRDLIGSAPLEFAFGLAAIFDFNEVVQDLSQLDELNGSLNYDPEELLLNVFESTLSFGAYYYERGCQKVWKVNVNMDSFELSAELVYSYGTCEHDWCNL